LLSRPIDAEGAIRQIKARRASAWRISINAAKANRWNHIDRRDCELRRRLCLRRLDDALDCLADDQRGTVFRRELWSANSECTKGAPGRIAGSTGFQLGGCNNTFILPDIENCGIGIEFQHAT
jgi:hypothetical protein